MKKQTFFRVCNAITKQGLWYDFQGQFSGLIHSVMNFCKNKDLTMDPDPELDGFLSATKTIEELFQWFPMADILKLQEHGFFIYEYETPDSRFYDRFQHWIICKEKSRIVKRIRIVIFENSPNAQPNYIKELI